MTPPCEGVSMQSELRFTGRADIVASLLEFRQIAHNAGTTYAECMDALNRHASLHRTLTQQLEPQS